ncbi:unnamed protein product [Musa banksii]
MKKIEGGKHGMLDQEAANSMVRIMFLNSKKSTRPSRSRSTAEIMRRTPSILLPSSSPSLSSTACSSAADMYPSPFSSNTRNASLISSSSSSAFGSTAEPSPNRAIPRAQWKASKSSKPRPARPGRTYAATAPASSSRSAPRPRRSSARWSSGTVISPSPLRSKRSKTRRRRTEFRLVERRRKEGAAVRAIAGVITGGVKCAILVGSRRELTVWLIALCPIAIFIVMRF